jgi:hypothetical protein
MRLRVLRFLLVAAVVIAGCDSGSGPGVDANAKARRAAEAAAAKGAPTEPGKKVSARLKKKWEKMGTSPASIED